MASSNSERGPPWTAPLLVVLERHWTFADRVANNPRGDHPRHDHWAEPTVRRAPEMRPPPTLLIIVLVIAAAVLVITAG